MDIDKISKRIAVVCDKKNIHDDINICTLRISFGRDNSSEDIDRLANAMISIINE